MLREPYLIVGFDVHPGDPNAGAIMADVQRDFPLGGILPLGVENVFAIEVRESQMIARFRQVTTYLVGKDQIHGGALRWLVQLCRSSELSSG